MEIFESATLSASVNTVLRQRPEACDFLIGRSSHLISNGKPPSTEPQGELHLREVSEIPLEALLFAFRSPELNVSRETLAVGSNVSRETFAAELPFDPQVSQ